MQTKIKEGFLILGFTPEASEELSKTLHKVILLCSERTVLNRDLSDHLLSLITQVASLYETVCKSWSSKEQENLKDSFLCIPLDQNNYNKYIASSLILNDKNPWRQDLTSAYITQLHALDPDPSFEYFNMLLCAGRVKNESQLEEFVRRYHGAKIQKNLDDRINQANTSLNEHLEYLAKLAKISDGLKDVIENNANKVNRLENKIEKSTINLITILGIFAAIMGFIIIGFNATINTPTAIPLLLVFGGTLFLFLLLLKSLSFTGNIWWFWVLLVVVCFFLIWTGLRTFAGQSLIP